jgi:hypothetical protein
MNIDYRFLLVACPLLILGCGASDEGGSAEQASEHVWSDQTDAIGTAEDVDQLIQQTADRHRQAIDEQGQ